ncbi:MAG: hypothetical protein Q7T20_10995 [Saprospiraceae bacterium]|nr:hypothetical protein [Saprospiraceae bacterium]
MTSHSPLPRLFPGFFFLSLALLSYLLNFNGLYGQDAHEYLRQSRVIFDRLQGLPIPPLSIGDAEFAGVYPLFGALFRFLTGDSVLALQMVSWLAAAMGLLVFERLLALLAPGARTDSRWAFAGLGLVFAPMFFRAGMTSMSDGLGLVFALATFLFGLRAFENRRGKDAVWTVAFAALALSTRYSLAALLLPLVIALTYYIVSKKRWLLLLATICVGLAALAPHFWLKTGGTENPLGHSSLAQWSAVNFFKSSFVSSNGGISHYLLPNFLFLLFPLAHPGFCLVLPGLFFLFKKTDLVLPAKRILLGSIAVYLILLGGMPQQNLRHLLPAYVLLLPVLFPAWDRLYCYGFLFFRRLTRGVLITALSLQILSSSYYLLPCLSRNRLETGVAKELKAVLPPDATVYAFDLDVALRSYLPGVQFQNLWERRYPEFQKGSFVLFNESLRAQWQGQNPILNWDHLKENYSLELRKELPKGWQLWEIRN